jgi:hypothetical protein
MPLGPRGRDDEHFITTGSIAGPRATIFIDWRWALALARRRCVSWRRAVGLGLPLPPALAVAALLGAAAFFPLRGGSIPLAGLPAAPGPGGAATRCTAIAGLRVGRRERALTAFQQTTPGAPGPPRLLPCTGKRMK